jgi:hypothetical protein
MDARIILREAENVQIQSLQAFPRYFRLERFFELKFLFLYAPCGVNLYWVPLQLTSWPIMQSFGLTFVYLLAIRPLSLSTPADKAFMIG